MRPDRIAHDYANYRRTGQSGGSFRSFGLPIYAQTQDQAAISLAWLTWDALGLVQKAVQSCGKITGNIEKDRKCVRDAMAKIKEYDGITGKMTFTEDGDPIKCAVVVKISDKGEYEFYKSVCP